MKSRFTTSVGMLTLLAAVTIPARLPAQSGGYNVIDLGPSDNPFSIPAFVNNSGLVKGSDTVFEGAVPRSHAVLWYKGMVWDIKQISDILQPGLLGPNSAAGPVNQSGLVALGGETLTPDPNNENFCAYGTGLQCVVFLWNNGVLTQLPNPLGGTNSGFGDMNNRGEVAGFAETAI